MVGFDSQAGATPNGGRQSQAQGHRGLKKPVGESRASSLGPEGPAWSRNWACGWWGAAEGFTAEQVVRAEMRAKLSSGGTDRVGPETLSPGCTDRPVTQEGPHLLHGSCSQA